MEKPQISDILYMQLSELHEISSNKARLLSPEEVKESPFFAMVEILQKITDIMTDTDEESNKLFAQYYSVCLRGVNPFKDSVLKKAGVDLKTWKHLLKGISGDF